ncbi:NAD(P)H-dependent flavin oxidoreductase [Parahaliea mediterranea]|uniref:Nitronate monooxygenase n=1 Tax=Parahaliea mediterranea TaxID=651086 RepID=A0A939DIM1_9GAMM|nr:nitronate monooxygenase [Parahaliea mediterranea]MBN7798217.1 nitronate monooxygenase [Parahaliea mediterranea]
MIEPLPNLRIPAFQAPMFLQSGPDMVIASCKAGVVGSFPSLNARTADDLEAWLQQITGELDPARDAPWAINLMMHRSNARRDEDLALAVKYQAPIMISALGSPRDAVEAIHGYGGKIYADVINTRFARKAIDAGVDGLVLVAAGAGGHTGQLSGFAFVEEVRRFWDGPIVLGGGISSGRAIRAAQVLGATYAYLGTRFIATHESMAEQDYKQMVVDASGEDIICSDALTGVKANWLRGSLEKAGYDPDNMPAAGAIDITRSAGDAKRWRDVWAAGQGAGAIDEILPIADLVDRLVSEYHNAREGG